MNKEQIQSVFERCGLGKIGEELAFKLWLKGLGDDCDEEMLECFLLAYDFQDEQSILVDDFLLHFGVFKKVLWRQELPFRYLD